MKIKSLIAVTAFAVLALNSLAHAQTINKSFDVTLTGTFQDDYVGAGTIDFIGKQYTMKFTVDLKMQDKEGNGIYTTYDALTGNLKNPLETSSDGFMMSKLSLTIDGTEYAHDSYETPFRVAQNGNKVNANFINLTYDSNSGIGGTVTKSEMKFTLANNATQSNGFYYNDEDVLTYRPDVTLPQLLDTPFGDDSVKIVLRSGLLDETDVFEISAYDYMPSNEDWATTTLSITPVADVPEPATLALLGAGALALVRRRRRKA